LAGQPAVAAAKTGWALAPLCGKGHETAAVGV
jgi:hypothetical protein